ncbi:hypothetical protein WISP_78144 [Willisornis vidua]|uniref:Craniofacial development protein 2-like n=1 Tax=Willisornis vidua TaxID=1566151 RepID=A0ABQ9D5I5_9PASS|nr:hypothetical protein WISP_78144 [Willisornis vidua]
MVLGFYSDSISKGDSVHYKVILITLAPYTSHGTTSNMFFLAYMPELSKLTQWKKTNPIYTDLHRLTQKVPANDMIIILGDFNARVGKNSEAWKGVLGKHSFGCCNDNGHLLLEFCAEQQLTITNSIFQQKDSLKTTWMHP